MGTGRSAHDCRRLVLWRTLGHDAACRGHVRLPSRGVLAAFGISVRLDIICCHRNRHDCRRRRCVRTILRCAVATRGRGQIPVPSGPPLYSLPHLPVNGPVAGNFGHLFPHLQQYFGTPLREGHPECIYDRQDPSTGRPDCFGYFPWAHNLGGFGKLQRALASEWNCFSGPRAGRDHNLGNVRRHLPQSNWIAILG